MEGFFLGRVGLEAPRGGVMFVIVDFQGVLVENPPGTRVARAPGRLTDRACRASGFSGNVRTCGAGVTGGGSRERPGALEAPAWRAHGQGA